MEEETKVKEEAKEEDTTSMIDKANEAAGRLEKANFEQARLLKRQEEIIARQALGGQSEAGTAPTAPKEETPQDYAKKVMSGDMGND